MGYMEKLYTINWLYTDVGYYSEIAVFSPTHRVEVMFAHTVTVFFGGGIKLRNSWDENNPIKSNQIKGWEGGWNEKTILIAPESLSTL